MGNTCKSMADSCQCMAKTTTKKKKKKQIKKKEQQQQQNSGLTCFLSASLKKNKNIQLKRFFPEQSDTLLSGCILFHIPEWKDCLQPPESPLCPSRYLDSPSTLYPLCVQVAQNLTAVWRMDWGRFSQRRPIVITQQKDDLVSMSVGLERRYGCEKCHHFCNFFMNNLCTGGN